MSSAGQGRTVRTVLRGHHSPETAYLVGDYPYGRTVRCRIRYWLERGKKGVRFVSQTEHPTTLRWNKPKASTYALITGAMYLDAEGHVQWANVNEYTGAAEALSFARDFVGPEGDADLRVWAAKKAAFAAKCAEGRLVVTINGTPKPWSDAEKAEHAAEATTWQQVADLCATQPASGGAS